MSKEINVKYSLLQAKTNVQLGIKWLMNAIENYPIEIDGVYNQVVMKVRLESIYEHRYKLEGVIAGLEPILGEELCDKIFKAINHAALDIDKEELKEIMSEVDQIICFE